MQRHVTWLVLVAAACQAPPVAEPTVRPRPALVPALPRHATLGCAAPLATPSRESAVELIADDVHTCARTATGAVACWGPERGGQLELCENAAHAATPVRLPFDGATQIALSSAGTCAIVDSRVQCTSGVHRTLANVDRAGNGELAVLAGATRIALGRSHVCAIVANEIVCIAPLEIDRTTGERQVRGREVLGPAPRLDGADYAAGVVPVASPRLLSAGLDFSCATDGAGAVWCWGRSPFGALGVPRAPNTNVPLRVGTLRGVVALASTPDGWNTCAVTHAGSAYCWGVAFGDRPRPVELSDVRHLAVGNHYACGVDGLGRMACEGDTTFMFGARLPAFSGPVAQLVGGAAHLCARLVGGTVECAGTEGYLGDGGPLPVADGAGFQVRLRPAVHVLGPKEPGAST